MNGNDVEAWHDLFVRVGGAAAALVGLLFVAVSINLEQVLELKAVPSLAARSLAVLLAQLVLSVLVLTPGQPVRLLCLEITALGIVLLPGVIVSAFRTHLGRDARWQWSVPTILLALISSAPTVVTGLSLVAEAGGGLYWAIVEVLTGFSVATYNAWVLLVEIRR